MKVYNIHSSVACIISSYDITGHTIIEQAFHPDPNYTIQAITDEVLTAFDSALWREYHEHLDVREGVFTLFHRGLRYGENQIPVQEFVPHPDDPEDQIPSDPFVYSLDWLQNKSKEFDCCLMYIRRSNSILRMYKIEEHDPIAEWALGEEDHVRRFAEQLILFQGTL